MEFQVSSINTLNIISYVPSSSYVVIQNATGTCKATWQTLVSTLTANITPAA